MRAPSLFDRLEVHDAAVRASTPSTPAPIQSVPKSVPVGTRRARLEVGVHGGLRAWLPHPVTDERAALSAACEFPGNVRFARVSGGAFLVADAPARDRAAVKSAADELGDTLRRATTDTTRAADGTPALDDENLHALLASALAHAALDAEALVQRAGGFELRPRFSGSAIAVRVASERAGLLFERVLFALPEDAAALAHEDLAHEALAHEALRWNARVIGARIVTRAGELVVQARLDPEHAGAARVAAAARSVAAATHHVRARLRVLATDRRAARVYAAMFLRDPLAPDNTGPKD